MSGRCFVITPYGEREVDFLEKRSDGAETKVRKPLDFDRVYSEIVEPAIKEAGYEPVVTGRQDYTLITRQMFEDLRSCDAALADITMPNPNVFYELGVRHVLRRNRTILIRHRDAARMSNDSDAPFDLTQLRRIYYRLDEVGIKSCSEKLTDMLRRTPGPDEFDSPVFEALPFLTVGQSGRSLRRDPRRPKFPLLARPDRSVGIIPGELRDVNHVDVWVNSENTQFEMARFGERAISSTIQALGSSKRQNEKGETKYGDEVNVDLQAAKQRVAPKQTHVPEAEAVLTPPRALSGSEHNVRRIAHVAAVKSEPGLGFDPVGNLGLCVKKVVAEIARYNRRWFASRDRKLRHVLFPLLATGQAMQSPQVVVPPLIDAAIEALEASHDNHLKAVYFLARTDVDFDLLDRQLRIRSDKLKVS